jgi:hypothetical protein
MKIYLASCNFIGRNDKKKYQIIRNRGGVFYFRIIFLAIRNGEPIKFIIIL